MQQQFDLAGYPYIALCDLLKLSGWVESGGQAKYLISSAQVWRNGVIEQRKSAKITAGETITLNQQTLEIIDSSQS